MGERESASSLVTLVFVDVESSTSLLDRVGDGDGLAAMARQLAAVSERVAGYGGRTVKSLGDGFLLTFSSPRQAVSFAVSTQRALAGSAPRLRFGIHTGEVDAIDGDPLGAAVNAGSRIAGRAAGGEVLVSDVVRQLVGTVPTVDFVDRGRCRLRGFTDRWHLWAAEDGTIEHVGPVTIGRLLELASIDELVASTAAGAGRVLLLEGEAGIGKTQLLSDAISRARRAGVTVVEAAADDVTRRPGVVAHGLVAAASPRLTGRARLADLLEAVSAPVDASTDGSYAVIEATVDVVEELARDRPVLVATEDVHWADDLSIRVLTAIARRARVSRFSVIAAMRPTPRSAALDRLVERVRDDGGALLRVGSLGDVDVHAMASVLTGGPPGEGLRQRLRATAGNPLYVTELLGSLDDEGALRVDAGVVEVAGADTPASLHETLVRRLSWLPPETNATLRIASLLGSTFTLHDVAAVTGQSVVDVAGTLREASLAGLVVGDGDRLGFRHELVREAVYHHMLSAERRDLHRAAASALSRSGAPIQQIADQFGRGAMPGDLEAVEWLGRAAADVESVSPAGAIRLLDKAIGLAPAGWDGRPALRARTIAPLVLCGRFHDAERLAEEILASSPSADLEFTALRGLSAAKGDRGDIAAALVDLRRAADAAGAPADVARNLRCTAAQIELLIGQTSSDEARRVAEQVLHEVEATQDAETESIAHQCLGFVAAIDGYGEVARDHLQTAVAILELGRVGPGPYQMAGASLVGALIELDAFEEAIAAADAARRRFEQPGALALLPIVHASTAGLHMYAGRFADALAETEAAMEISEDVGNTTWLVVGMALKGMIAVHHGDLDTAQSHLDAATRRIVEVGPIFGTHWLLEAQIELLIARQQHAAAVVLAENVWAQTEHIRHFIGCRIRGCQLVRLAVHAGREELARTVTADIEEGARRTPVDSAIAAGKRCRGLLENDPDLLVDAVAHYRRTPRVLELAMCHEDAARVLAAQGRRTDAVAQLRAAAGLWADMEAPGDLARVDALLRTLDARRQRQRPARPAFGWDSLTPTETNVTRLAADGLTNPEIGARLFISRRTVETHLSHVFRKLDLSNRTQLVAELARRPPMQPA